MKESKDLLWQIIDTIPTLARLHRPLSQTSAGLGWKVAIHPDDLPRMLQIFQGAVNSGQLSRWKAAFAVSTVLEHDQGVLEGFPASESN